MPYASRPLADLLEPAIAYARDGFAVYPRLARAIAALEGASDVSAGLADLLAGNGRTEGEILRQADLVRSLADVAADPSVMYDGALADAIVAGLQGRGARLGTADLAEHRTEWVAPLRARYRGYEVATHPPVSLGCVLLEELRILEGFDLASFAPGQPELIPLEVAAAAAAAEDADRYLGDPAGVAEALAAILSDDRAAWWRERLADERHETRAAVATGSDTTSIVAADSAGNVACLLQSLFNEWGSRELVAGTGVLLNDRLANLRVGGDHHNRLRPGQRPLHTLHAYLVLSEDRFAIAGATPGGRGQAQTNLQVLVNMLDLGDDVQTAIDRPRWLRGLPRRGEDRTVYLEAGSASAVGERLREAGHPVEDAPRGALEAFGNCTVVARDAVTGQILAGADRRRGAHAMAW
jgi:gamma-glutamyltranspeptidase/glutathione hydrolase